MGNNHSVAGIVDADGNASRLDDSSTGDFAGGAVSADFDGDHDVDNADFTHLRQCAANGADHTPPAADVAGRPCQDTDLDRDTDVDGSDLVLFQVCMSGEGVPPPPQCAGGAPPSGTYTLHGLPVDVLPDGHAFLFARARFYDLKNGRWLQRDPLGYVDGGNLYEAFKGNPLAVTDPEGLAGRLRSGWQDGDKVLLDEVGWFSSDEVATVGRYHFERGRRFVRYMGGIDNDPLQPDFYQIDFETLEQWARQQSVTRKGFERFIRQHGTPYRREGDRFVALRPSLESIGGFAGELVEDSNAQSLADSPTAFVYDVVVNGGSNARERRQALAYITEAAAWAVLILADTQPNSRPVATIPERFASRGAAAENGLSIAARQKMVAARTADQIALRRRVADLLYQARDGGMTPGLVRSLRVAGAGSGWAEEAQMVRMTGQGTRAWSAAEIDQLLTNGQVTDFTPHHINSAAQNPWLAGNPNNIQIVERWTEHGTVHGGNTQLPTQGPLINRSQMMIDWLTGR